MQVDFLVARLEPVALTIIGPPRTKKTSNRIVRVGNFSKVMPSDAYREYERGAIPQLFAQRLAATSDRIPCGKCEGKGYLMVGKKKPQRVVCPRCAGAKMQAPPITGPVVVAAAFYRKALQGDWLGFAQACADILEAAGVLADDEQIRYWPLPADGREPLRKDAARPRVELVISELAT